VALGATFLFSPSAEAATRLGGISVWNACVYQSGTPNGVGLASYTAVGWRCLYYSLGTTYQVGVDLNQECRRTFGSGAVAKYTNYNDPYSWGCYR